MKHNINATVIIITIFFLTQIFGLYLLKQDITNISEVNGSIFIEHQETVIGPRPETTGGESFLYIAISILIGTILILLIMRYQKTVLWKTWFFLAIFISISISLGVLLEPIYAFTFSLIISLLKVFKRNVFTHNLSEILMYSGLAILLVPILTLGWTILLLIIISLYDMYAVWKSKHMVRMAKFQTKNKLFAGLMIPYENKKGVKIHLPPKPNLKDKKLKNAILGGGDVSFPLIFSGVAMESLILNGISPEIAFFKTLIISIVVTLSILGLFFYAKKEHFYPAMPVVTFGCLLGYLIMLLF